MGQPHDHYISRAHMRQWAINNRVTVLRRGWHKPKPLDIGKAVAAEQGLNNPTLEQAYGKVEDAFSRALPRLLNSRSTHPHADWKAIQEYAVLMHDRYPALRGSAADKYGLSGGNIMMVPNPARWGGGLRRADHLGHLAQVMDRERLKEERLRLMPINAFLLPPRIQIIPIGPLLLGDAGIHAIILHPDDKTEHSYVAMPVTPTALVVFGNRLIEQEAVSDLAGVLNMKTAMESTVLIDTPEAPVINSFASEMWRSQPEPSGTGVPTAVHVWSRIEDIPNSRPNER